MQTSDIMESEGTSTFKVFRQMLPDLEWDLASELRISSERGGRVGSQGLSRGGKGRMATISPVALSLP